LKLSTTNVKAELMFCTVQKNRTVREN